MIKCCFVFILVQCVLTFASGPLYADQITLAADRWYPYNGEPGDTPPGYMIDIARIALEKQGHTVSYKVMSWERALSRTREGSNTCLMPTGAGDCDGVAYCRMFNQIAGGNSMPKYLSSDNDPLFLFHRWKANLRILEIDELKSVPGTPTSHPFIERVIGTTRREYLDQLIFSTGLICRGNFIVFKVTTMKTELTHLSARKRQN